MSQMTEYLRKQFVKTCKFSKSKRSDRPINIADLVTFCVALSIAIPSVANATNDWNGTWNVRWNQGGGRLTFSQQGDVVTGEYEPQNGRIEATVHGAQLDGKWTEGKQTGSVTFILNQDKSNFTASHDAMGWWTGNRTDTQELKSISDLRTPRNAFVSFITSANIARAGREDAWGLVQNAAEFEAPDEMMTRLQSLEYIREYFKLIDLTTFNWWSLPTTTTKDSIDLELEQLQSSAVLTVTLRRNAQGDWHVIIPSEGQMDESRKSLLAIYGANPPTDQSFRRLQNPRDTMRAFLEGMNDWNNSTGDGRALALSTIDLSALPEFLRKPDSPLVAQYLRRTLHKIGMTGLQSIPNDSKDHDPYVHFSNKFGSIVIAPTGSAAGAPWQFTKATVDQIPDVYFGTADLSSLVNLPYGKIPPSIYFTMRDFVAKKMPFLLGRLGRLEFWQLFAVMILLPIGFKLARILAKLLTKALNLISDDGPDRSRTFGWALTFIIAALILQILPSILGIPERPRRYSLPVLGCLICISSGFVAWHILNIFSSIFIKRARESAKESDDIIVNFTVTGLRVVIALSSLLGMAYYLSIPATNILAGLGIGGLAFAIAARGTLENIFGAGTLVSDRPFRSGDWIDTGSVQGSVEAVGIRSTRIRTAQDSVTIIPNGKLSEVSINNLGTRRHRVIKLKIPITEGITLDRLQKFIDALRTRITNDSTYITDQTEIGISDIGDKKVVLSITTYIDVRTDRAEGEVRHALLMDMMLMAQTFELKLGCGLD